MPTAMLPTPPVAPVTATGPLPVRKPLRSSRTTDSAAVKPAVPRIIASRRDSPAGSRTTQSAGTRTRAAKPPSCPTPRS